MDAVAELFIASRGLFDNFVKRTCFHSVARRGVAASSDDKTSEAFVKTFLDFIKIGGYIAQQVFNRDETGLFWKKIPRKTYVTEEEKKMRGQKPLKNRPTLELCSIASGDCKVKLLIVYHSRKSRAFMTNKSIKEKLHVMWRSNQKAWVTRQIFTE